MLNAVTLIEEAATAEEVVPDCKEEVDTTVAVDTVDTGTVSASSFSVMVVVPIVVVLGAATDSIIVQVAFASEDASPHCTPTFIVAKTRPAVSVRETCDAS